VEICGSAFSDGLVEIVAGLSFGCTQQFLSALTMLFRWDFKSGE